MLTTTHIWFGVFLLIILSVLRTSGFISFPDRWPFFRSTSNYYSGWSYQPQYNNLRYYYPGTTRNMSRDIRGDPYIPYAYTGPWNQASVFPIRNRRLVIGN